MNNLTDFPYGWRIILHFLVSSARRIPRPSLISKEILGLPENIGAKFYSWLLFWIGLVSSRQKTRMILGFSLQNCSFGTLVTIKLKRSAI